MKKQILRCAAVLFLLALLALHLPLSDGEKREVISASRADMLLTRELFLSERVPANGAQAFVLMDADSGRLFGARAPDLQLPMASTTKIMTALLALEWLEAEETFTVPSGAVGVEGSSMYLVAGETLTARELLYGLLLESGNDAAEALALWVGGSEAEFVRMMNEKAAALGLADTHFTNPHGLPDEEHRTTAYDLALLTREALRNEAFTAIVSTRTAVFPHGTYARYMVNHNKLLGVYEGLLGVKTGYTKAAGRCLVTAAKRDGVTLIAVTLNDPSGTADHAALLDFGFAYTERKKLFSPNEIKLSAPVTDGEQASVTLMNTAELYLTVPKAISLTADTVLYGTPSAPVACGEVLGEVRIYADGQALYALPLMAVEDVKVKKQSMLERWFG